MSWILKSNSIKKKFLLILVVFAILLCATGCQNPERTTDPSEAQKPSQSNTHQDSKKTASIEIIGKWRNESKPVVTNSTIVIYRQLGKYRLSMKFDEDGSELDEEVRQEKPTQFRRINFPVDYFVISKNGYLEARDNDGVVFTARPIK